MPFTQPRIFLTTKEVAQRLGGRCNFVTVIDLINVGKLKGKKVGREWRILPEWLDEYMSKPDHITICKTKNSCPKE
jgi:excisionase family DNA binding protein